MVPTVAVAGSALCTTGSCRYLRTRRSTSWSSVAENSRPWTSSGSRPMMASISGMKPRSAMWSASSRTTTWTLAQVDRAAIGEVDEAAGRGHDDVGALEPADLAVVRTASDDQLGPHARRGGQRLERVDDLHRELTGRGQDQPARLALGCLGPFRIGEHRQAERQRLARAGATSAQHVATARAAGMVMAWIGVGSVIAWLARTAASEAGTPRSTNAFGPVRGGTCGARVGRSARSRRSLRGPRSKRSLRFGRPGRDERSARSGRSWRSGRAARTGRSVLARRSSRSRQSLRGALRSSRGARSVRS